mgnify:CR=1 FL=1
MRIVFRVKRLGFRGLCLAATLFFCSAVCAQNDFEEANTAYAEGRYAEAAADYQALLIKSGEAGYSSDSRARLYYNLGNAFFRQGEVAQSILAYERALRLKPYYPEARHNLRYAESRITDNIPDQDFFLSTWARAIRNTLSEPVWFALSIALFIVALAGTLLFLLARVAWGRKTAFYVALAALFLCLAAGLNGLSLHQRDALRAEAIITQGVVNAKAAPDRSGTDLFTIHEGTKVTIRETIGDWANIRVGANEGWVLLQHLERI